MSALDHGGRTALHLVAERGIQKMVEFQGAESVPGEQTWPYAITSFRSIGIWGSDQTLGRWGNGLRGRQCRTHSA